ncbi:hypothetical protein [Ancylobacter terrae]|uniref:hypothetical protein n=1 Tax=Ancylobacter sp. sgz301288 TaxID=3342077 RepID=UPI0038591E25
MPVHSNRIVRRAALAVLAAATVLGTLAGSAQAQGVAPIIVRPPPGVPDNGVPPTFQEYPLWDRIFGSGGAVFPGYRMPPTDRRGRTPVSLLTGSGAGRTLFAAGTADNLCQWQQVPTITVLTPPATGRLSTDIGPFIVTGVDGGNTLCLGRQVRGTRLNYAGPLPLRPQQITVRVAYPFRSSYTHVVTIPAR